HRVTALTASEQTEVRTWALRALSKAHCCPEPRIEALAKALGSGDKGAQEIAFESLESLARNLPIDRKVEFAPETAEAFVALFPELFSHNPEGLVIVGERFLPESR